MNEQDYPPLPETVREVITLHQPTEYTEHVVTGSHYTADQMRAYAAAAIAQQSARNAEELAAYALTVANLKSRKEELIAACVSAELRARQATETDGWKLVPIEPTADMYIRGGEAFFDLVYHATDDGDTEEDQEHAASIYRAMLESAPQAQPERYLEEQPDGSFIEYAPEEMNQPERKPMKATDIVALHKSIEPKATAISELMLRTIRAVESFHGIKETL